MKEQKKSHWVRHNESKTKKRYLIKMLKNSFYPATSSYVELYSLRTQKFKTTSLITRNVFWSLSFNKTSRYLDHRELRRGWLIVFFWISPGVPFVCRPFPVWPDYPVITVTLNIVLRTMTTRVTISAGFTL